MESLRRDKWLKDRCVVLAVDEPELLELSESEEVSYVKDTTVVIRVLDKLYTLEGLRLMAHIPESEVG
jgi:hypothetical protein